jgi:hypothetical protein
MTFDELFSRYEWRAIPGCPGRYVLRPGGAPRDLPIEALASGAAIVERRSPKARDAVLAAALPGGGLISYRRADGSFCHTLNTPEGFLRKLAQLGLAPPAGPLP